MIAVLARWQLFCSGIALGLFTAIVLYVIWMVIQDAKAAKHKRYMAVSKRSVLRATENKVGEGADTYYYASYIQDPLLSHNYNSTVRDLLEPVE